MSIWQLDDYFDFKNKTFWIQTAFNEVFSVNVFFCKGVYRHLHQEINPNNQICLTSVVLLLLRQKKQIMTFDSRVPKAILHSIILSFFATIVSPWDCQMRSFFCFFRSPKKLALLKILHVSPFCLKKYLGTTVEIFLRLQLGTQ